MKRIQTQTNINQFLQTLSESTANGTQVLVQPLSSEAQQQITGGERTGADRLVLYTEELKTNPNARL